jgi:4-amino-4-deoxy-L-arabinose transferase-like glycosyltransferase
MIETRAFLRIRSQNEARNKKPAGIYWLQAASIVAFGDVKSDAIWLYRRPSLLGGTAAVLLTFGIGQGLTSRREALIGAGLLAATFDLAVEAHIANTDGVLLATAVAAQGALGLIYCGGQDAEPAARGWALLFWFAQALAIPVKGPVAPVLSVLTVTAMSIADGDARWFKRFRWGLPLLLVIVGPWLIAINHATGGAFFSESFGGDFVGKLIGGAEAHGAPPLTRLLMLMVGFWPTTFLPGRIIAQGWNERRAVASRFIIAGRCRSGF